MNILASINDYFQKKVPFSTEKSVVEVYDIWAGYYDAQPSNFMLDLDEVIFLSLFQDIQLQNKNLNDIGFATGKQWQKLYDRSPAVLTGYDVSGGMLYELTKKIPSAITRHISDNKLTDTKTTSVVCIISTLIITHLKNAEEAIASWARILKNNGDMIIADFHYDILASVGKRSFSRRN